MILQQENEQALTEKQASGTGWRRGMEKEVTKPDLEENQMFLPGWLLTFIIFSVEEHASALIDTQLSLIGKEQMNILDNIWL